MTTDTKYDNKIHANLCEAIKSLSPENKFAFAPFLSAEERNLMREATEGNIYDEASAIAKLAKSIENRAMDQLSECLNIDSAKFYPALRFENDCRKDTGYKFHTDNSPYGADAIRLTLSLKGKGTAFTSYQPIEVYSDTVPAALNSDLVLTPDLHLGVFTITGQHGAIHSPPIYDQSEVDCSRAVLLIYSPLHGDQVD